MIVILFVARCGRTPDSPIIRGRGIEDTSVTKTAIQRYFGTQDGNSPVFSVSKTAIHQCFGTNDGKSPMPRFERRQFTDASGEGYFARRKFFSASSWDRSSSNTEGDASLNSLGSSKPGQSLPSSNNGQRPTFLRSLDLKALPANDALGNNSPSETQKRRTKYQFFEKQCSKISEGLYLSGDAVAKNWETLHDNRITHVVNCVGFICQEYFLDKGVKYRTYFLQDTPAEDILCVLYDAFEFIDSALGTGGRVLVHCSQGVSRSATIVIAYLMWRTGATYDDAFATVKTARGVANPNIVGFCCQLLQWQKRRQPKAAMRVRLHRIAPQSKYAPTQLVPKVVVPPKQYRNNTFRDLDPRGAFIIQTPERMWVWTGAQCPDEFAERAEYHARLYPKYESASQSQEERGVVVVRQDEEGAEFASLMDPPLLDDDQQRINAQRNSITGDLLAGTSGLTGFNSLGLVLGSASNASTPRSRSPAPEPRSGDSNSSSRLHVATSARSMTARVPTGEESKPTGEGAADAAYVSDTPSRGGEGVDNKGGLATGGEEVPASSHAEPRDPLSSEVDMENSSSTLWDVGEVDEYNSDFDMYREGAGCQLGLLLSQSMGLGGVEQLLEVCAPRGGGQGGPHKEDSAGKKHRRSDFGGCSGFQIPVKAMKEGVQGLKALHESFDI
eukprot:gene17618-23955_t